MKEGGSQLKAFGAEEVGRKNAGAEKERDKRLPQTKGGTPIVTHGSENEFVEKTSEKNMKQRTSAKPQKGQIRRKDITF